MNNNEDHAVWVEKFRPQTVAECILPTRIKKQFTAFVKKGDFPHLLLSGGAGTGKSACSKALCADLGFDVILINASDERNIDVVRGSIKTFASQTSMAGNRKAIILDEVDGMSAIAQRALRAAIEEFPSVRFILTCNYKNKLIEPIHSRTATISFNIKKEERSKPAVDFLKRLFEILESEDIPYDKAVVGAVLKKYYPDNRRILNELQRYSIAAGEIDVGMLAAIDKINTTDLIEACKARDIGKLRQWIVDNIDTDPTAIFREIYDSFYTEVEPHSVPDLVLALGDYQFKAGFVADQEINMMACLITIMGDVEFK